MNHLIDSHLVDRLQVNLAESRQFRMGHGALWFNTFMLLGVVGFVFVFLYAQYNSNKQVLQPVNIEKREFIWNNSIRNSIEL